MFSPLLTITNNYSLLQIVRNHSNSDKLSDLNTVETSSLNNHMCHQEPICHLKMKTTIFQYFTESREKIQDLIQNLIGV